MSRLLTVRRRMFLIAPLALALVAIVLLYRTPSGTAGDTAFQENDIFYVENSTTFTPSSGSLSSGQVTFGLQDAYISSTSIANGPEASGVEYQSYAGCIESGVAAGAADASYVRIDTSGYSLPLTQSRYLPVTLSASYSGTDVSADTTFSGTVLAHAGFSTSNPDFELTDTQSTVGITYESSGGGGGGGGGGGEMDNITSADPYGYGGYFIPASFGSVKKEKKYRLNMKKDVGVPALTDGIVKNWKSNMPKTEDLTNVGLGIESVAMQYDAASNTFTVKQKVRVKNAKKAKAVAGLF